MATPRKHWFKVAGPTEGSLLYAAERVCGPPVIKIGRTINLRRRLREFPDPYAPRCVRMIYPGEDAITLERELHAKCPFPLAGPGREWYAAELDELWGWLNGQA